MAARTESRKGRSYTFRRYEPGDAAGFLDLFERIWGERRSEEWVRWRFEANPYLDHVPMFVAESGGSIVGTRPFLAFRMAVGDGTALALLTVDTMVHPDHRRRGLFTTTTERALDYYADREPAFVFNQPNADSRPGYRNLGFRELDPMRTYYRVQRPSAFGDRLGVPGATAASRVADGLVTGYHRLRDGRRWRTDDVTVRCRADVATDDLTTLHRRAVPPGITAHRDEAFYDWRYASPAWSRRTYVAARNGERIAGVLARTRTTAEGVRVTQVADVVPLRGDGGWKRGLAACVERVLADATDADVVSAPARAFPADLASSYGFLGDDGLPLSSVAATDEALCVRSLRTGEGAWRVNGVSLCDPTNWQLTFAERDTA